MKAVVPARLAKPAVPLHAGAREVGEDGALPEADADHDAWTGARILELRVVVVVGVVGLFGEQDFSQIADVAAFLIAALLPSEAGVRFGRALWLKQVPAEEITDQALKKI